MAYIVELDAIIFCELGKYYIDKKDLYKTASNENYVVKNKNSQLVLEETNKNDLYTHSNNENAKNIVTQSHDETNPVPLVDRMIEDSP